MGYGNLAFTSSGENGDMDVLATRSAPAKRTCDHRWQYYVEVASKRVRSRRCSQCGEERPVGAREAAQPVQGVRVRLSA
jgi:hypothetical protein